MIWESWSGGRGTVGSERASPNHLPSTASLGLWGFTVPSIHSPVCLDQHKDAIWKTWETFVPKTASERLHHHILDSTKLWCWDHPVLSDTYFPGNSCLWTRLPSGRQTWTGFEHMTVEWPAILSAALGLKKWKVSLTQLKKIQLKAEGRIPKDFWNANYKWLWFVGRVDISPLHHVVDLQDFRLLYTKQGNHGS